MDSDDDIGPGATPPDGRRISKLSRTRSRSGRTAHVSVDVVDTAFSPSPGGEPSSNGDVRSLHSTSYTTPAAASTETVIHQTSISTMATLDEAPLPLRRSKRLAQNDGPSNSSSVFPSVPQAVQHIPVNARPLLLRSPSTSAVGKPVPDVDTIRIPIAEGLADILYRRTWRLEPFYVPQDVMDIDGHRALAEGIMNMKFTELLRVNKEELRSLDKERRQAFAKSEAEEGERAT